jgi:SAM-dependent methyltransferase
MNNQTSEMRKFLKKASGKVQKYLRNGIIDAFPLNPKLPLPEGISESELFEFLKTVLVSDAPPQEMENYCRHDFRRFVYTYGLARDLTGKCLELGSNPYFTTILLKEFTDLKLSLANYFGPNRKDKVIQGVVYKNFKTKENLSIHLESSHFNIEEQSFPFRNEEFDIALFCEIIEHLLMDPAAVLKEIKRVLKPNGVLVLTTPNVSRLENVLKMISGENIYDPYSGYGPYGRHNREYNKHELNLLLNHLGFTVDSMFTADVHQNNASSYPSLSKLTPLLKNREYDLGQYIFVRAFNTGKAREKKLASLYRSYPADELE